MKSRSIAAGLILLAALGSARAADLAGRFGAVLHGELASVRGQRAIRQHNLDAAMGLGGMAYYNFTQEWAAGAAYTDIDLSNGFRAEPIEAVVIRRFPLSDQDWAPYIRAGAGISRGVDTRSYGHAAASAALGLERHFDDFAVGAEGLWRYISDTGDSRLHAHLAGAGLNVTWFFPCRAKTTAASAPAAPVEIPAAEAPEKVSIELKVLFDTAKHDVKPEFHAEIQRVADFMKSYPDTKAEIEGHTDNQGEADYNRGLSQRRADAVRQVLIDNFDIPADRLTAKGYGPDQPIADNGTEEGRTRNRRVVAILTATKR